MTSIKIISVYCFFCLLFLVDSFVAVVCLGVWIALKERINNNYFYFIAVLLSVFASLFNVTKYPENDLAMYLNYYHLIPKLSFSQYLELLGGKDFLYQAYTWLIYYLSSGSDKAFVFFITFTAYMFYCEALIIPMKKLELDNHLVIMCFAFLFFFPFIFFSIPHTIRQCLGFSIMSYVLMKKIFDNKNLWYLGIVAGLVHSAVFFFLPFLFIGFLKKRLRLENVFVYLFLGGIMLFIKEIAFFFQGVNRFTSLNFLLDRAANGTSFETTLSMGQMLLSAFLVFFLIVSLYVIKPWKKIPEIVHFSNITLILFIFMLMNWNYGEMLLRFNLFFWFLTPFFICFYLFVYKVKRNTVLILWALLLIGWNVYMSEFCPFRYEASSLYWLYPAFLYLL